MIRGVLGGTERLRVNVDVLFSVKRKRKGRGAGKDVGCTGVPILLCVSSSAIPSVAGRPPSSPSDLARDEGERTDGYRCTYK